MKTKIIDQYSLKEWDNIYKCIWLSENQCVLYIKNNWEQRIELYWEYNKTIYFNELWLKKYIDDVVIFKYGNWFWLLCYDKDGIWFLCHEKIFLWANIKEKYIHNKISNYKLVKYNEGYTYAYKECKYIEETNSLICTLRERNHPVDLPVYYTIFDLDKLKWRTEKHLLNIKHFPKTFFSNSSYPDKLSITSLWSMWSNIYLHSTWWKSTRLKNWENFEFSNIEVLDTKLGYIRNFKFENGRWYFSSDNKYFILNLYVWEKNVRKVLLYNTDNFVINKILPITPKQNLWDNKKWHFKIDIYWSRLWIYNYGFLNICEIIED